MSETVNETKKEVKKAFKPQLAVIKKDNQKELLRKRLETWEKNNTDLIVIKINEKVTEEKGRKIIEQVQEKINVTRKVNATAQILKQKTAIEKLNEIKNMI